MIVLVTGAAGFIGFHLAKRLKALGHEVVGIDNFNAYYDPSLKKARATLLEQVGVEVVQGDIADEECVRALFEKYLFTHIAHLAAQAGVRASLTHPRSYLRPNVEGPVVLLEACKENKTPFIYASSSSVYGTNSHIPFAETDRTDRPANLYGATKKMLELLAYSYNHLYQIPVTGLRFFTVYGPFGRPDMAVFFFTKALFDGAKIPLFNGGEMERDFTYIDDVVDAVVVALEKSYPLEIFNIGNHRPEKVCDLVRLLEQATHRKALTYPLAMQPGEIKTTFAEIDHAKTLLGFLPKTELAQGVALFVEWYRSYYGT